MTVMDWPLLIDTSVMSLSKI